MARGASAVLCTRQVDAPHVLVTDCVQAYGDIAKLHRQSLKAAVVAITGSSGKTSTKDLLAHVLRQCGATIAPPGNFNNELGLPRTVLSAQADTDFLVLEMGMRGIGHIQYLCEIAAPQVGVVLNVGTAHIELLGSREAIAAAKSEIVQSLPSDGVAVLYADDAVVAAMAHRTSARVVTFGESPSADVRISAVHLDENARPRFTLTYAGESFPVALHMVGEHQALNAAAVVAAAIAVGIEPGRACSLLDTATSESKWRMEVTELPNNITIINDAYNANPESMRVGLKTLKAMAHGRRSWAILGEMKELGAESMTAHDDIGRLCVRLDINRMVGIGDAGKIMQMGAAQEGSYANEAQWVDTPETAVQLLKAEINPGDVIFIKASRGVALERVASALIEHFSRENTRP